MTTQPLSSSCGHLLKREKKNAVVEARAVSLYQSQKEGPSKLAGRCHRSGQGTRRRQEQPTHINLYLHTPVPRVR